MDLKRPPIRCVLATLLVAAACAPAPAPGLPPASRLAGVETYIHQAWSTLTRSNRDLPEAARDSKVQHVAGTPWPVYVAASEDVREIRERLRALLGEERFRTIDIRPLPPDPSSISQPGLLYLPNPYVVPGGRFNEMYGWDSYFIEVGLLLDCETDLARDIVDNFLYEVRRFGKVLNANRTYYLQRSQPPFLARMVLDLYDRTHDRDWLRAAVPAIESTYAFWTTEPHLVPGIGLSRYYALGEGPAPEVVYGERDAQGRSHYDRVREYYRTHRVTAYDVGEYYDRANDRLTPLFYKGDRSVRESGFDPSNRFGPFGVDIIHYAPVGLNTLLYQMELDASSIARILGDARGEATWDGRARVRRERMDRYLWDEDAGLYFDYDVQARQRRRYEFATTFYPLWAGAASPEQAARVHGNLGHFEAPGGILTSTQVTGSQWDAPFGWAPLQMIAVGGLRRYGYASDADRIAAKFVSLVVEQFERTGTIVEKYDVVRRQSELGEQLRFGYRSNEVGFGWTNAAVLDLLAGLRGAETLAPGREHAYVPGSEDRAGAAIEPVGPRLAGSY
jgi:alpha,alpha-trehalase